MFRYLREHKWPLVLCMGLLLVQAVCNLLLPSYMSGLVDVGIVELGGTASQMGYILGVGVRMLAVSLLGVAAAAFVNYLAAKISAKVAEAMRGDVFERTEQFSLAEFDKFSSASLITRTTNDIQQIQNFVGMAVRIMGNALFLGVGGIIMALSKSPSLSWIIALAVLVIVGLIACVAALVIPRFTKLQQLTDRLNLICREQLSGLMVVRAFGNEELEERRFEEANREYTGTNRFVQRVTSMLTPAMTLVMNAVTVAIVWVGSSAIASSSLALGDMMAFIQYAMMIIMAFLLIAVMFVLIPRALASARRIQEVLDTRPSLRDPEHPVPMAAPEGVVEFRNVSFRYAGAEEEVLHDISFTARPGETTAFIGSTGSGKSTLINLIPRFYDVSEGSVLLDGVDVRELAQKDLRNAIGYVSQTGVLFSGTIASNVLLGKGDAGEEEIASALDTAQATEFVQAREDGTESGVTAGGSNVSGGQKQRLSIARALVRKPAVYIFDDSFSALDYATDARLRGELARQTTGSTVLIVAQRVSTIRGADQIIVLDNGAVVGKGTHGELLESCPAYREIAESQLSQEEIA